MIGFFEEVVVGGNVVLGTHVFTAEDIKRYAARFDPQPFHLDEKAAKDSLFGGLCASGWQTAMVCARLLAQAQRRYVEEQMRAGFRAPRFGPSPGFRELKWIKPVYVGDTVTYAAEVTGKREDAGRDGFGLIALRNTGENQRGERVISFVAELLVEKRPT